MKQEQSTEIKPLSLMMLKPKSGKEWAICLVGWMTSLGIIYLSVFYEVVYRATVLLFLVSFAVIVLQKLREMKSLLERKQDKEGEQTAPIANEVGEEEATVTVEATNEQTRIFEGVKEKEQALRKIELDQTLLMEDLFKKADLDEIEKQQFRSRFEEKQVERTTLLTELSNAKAKIQQAFLDTKSLFVKEDPVKELATLLELDSFEDPNLEQLNQRIKSIKSLLKDSHVHTLQKDGYLDEQYKLTRLGYKALIRFTPKKQGEK
ncbi:hypothetical protein [Alkalihalobacillus pseudalcaliphilus]|uniref:hypothetical protein n=1 Tax=Alkalihalobacillus pseudalcaliphilus TaxID=79884 RepID=UPI00064DF740|nr:hypothetical protein [Alkalihalobacillus pseudalcaliphilus]KMK75523.1 hypothetical protein AB990_09500 [Alkalihalobacillus pseudalcaliphilus]